MVRKSLKPGVNLKQQISNCKWFGQLTIGGDVPEIFTYFKNTCHEEHEERKSMNTNLKSQQILSVSLIMLTISCTSLTEGVKYLIPATSDKQSSLKTFIDCRICSLIPGDPEKNFSRA